MMDKVPKEKIVSINFSGAHFSHLDFSIPVDGIDKLYQSIDNKVSALRNIPEERTPYVMIWRCRPWFCSTRSISEQSSLVWSTSALHMQI
jgi:hypothetical protein